MKILWIRGNDRISFNQPQRWFCLGIIGSAKSSLLETIAERYLQHGHTVLDLFGSRDGEGLAWLRSPWVKEKKVLLLHGDNVEVKAAYDAKNVSKLTLKDFNKYDILISATPLYLSPDQEYRQVNQVLNLLYKRQSWRRLIYAVVREASNLFYSRIRVSKNQLMAKSECIYLIRESRHMGVSLGMDSLRFYSLDIDVRSVVDYQVIKSMGLFGLPDDLEWLYHMISPAFIRNMPRPAFVLLSKSGAIGLGTFSEIAWHKQEGEHILKAVDLKVEYGEEPQYGEDRHVFKTVGDYEHAEIMALYLDHKQGMHRIAKLKKRSTSTIQAQVKVHDQAVERSGFCARCRRIGGKHDVDMALKQRGHEDVR